jgi:hypothetical protein
MDGFVPGTWIIFDNDQFFNVIRPTLGTLIKTASGEKVQTRRRVWRRVYPGTGRFAKSACLKKCGKLVALVEYPIEPSVVTRSNSAVRAAMKTFRKQADLHIES